MTKSSTLALAFLIGAVAGCSEPGGQAPATMPPEVAAYDTATMAALDDYEIEAMALVEGIGRGDPTEALVARVERLLELADAMMPAFIARHPGCGAYLEAARQVRHRWRDLDADTLERDYHHDGALPSEGTTPACYHAKDLVVHPASAAALLSQDPPDVAAARREISEVLAHLDVVRRG